jgi:hypothetical protein
MGNLDFTKQSKEVVPDLPVQFGYNICWYAIKGETPQTVIEKLNLKTIRESNWADGIDCAYNHQQYLFISPPVDGYALVINITPDDEHTIVKNHAALFKELQYFGTHHVTEYHAWAKFADGKVIRAYCYVGESGEVTWSEGNVTTEEMNLGFDKFPSRTEELLSDDLDFENFPGEEDVLAIAAAWGADPAFQQGNQQKGTGFICTF